ncbi:hypothetical protein SARC_08898, partial [Sphaeroforma arctica JP610]
SLDYNHTELVFQNITYDESQWDVRYSDGFKTFSVTRRLDGNYRISKGHLTHTHTDKRPVYTKELIGTLYFSYNREMHNATAGVQLSGQVSELRDWLTVGNLVTNHASPPHNTATANVSVAYTGTPTYNDTATANDIATANATATRNDTATTNVTAIPNTPETPVRTGTPMYVRDRNGLGRTRPGVVTFEEDRLVGIIGMLKDGANHELYNFAVMNGVAFRAPFIVKGITTCGLTDEMVNATCHSSDEGILKVSGDCQSVAVDGSEQSGGHNVAVNITTDNHSIATTAYFRVWYPTQVRRPHTTGYNIHNRSQHTQQVITYTTGYSSHNRL